MALYNHIDSLICKIFLSKLKGNAMKWYADIPYGSITDFRTLSDEFIKVFSAYKKGLRKDSIKFKLGKKLHKPKYEHITLAECFDKGEEIVIWDEEYRMNGRSLKPQFAAEPGRESRVQQNREQMSLDMSIVGANRDVCDN
ncbi:hypothetical protein ACFX13_041807 [Malus domestica]